MHEINKTVEYCLNFHFGIIMFGLWIFYALFIGQICVLLTFDKNIAYFYNKFQVFSTYNKSCDEYKKNIHIECKKMCNGKCYLFLDLKPTVISIKKLLLNWKIKWQSSSVLAGYKFLRIYCNTAMLNEF